MANGIERMIADTFMEMAQGLETGSFGKRPKVALTGMGSEHGEENSMAAAIEAAKDGIDVYYIGTLEAEGVTTVKVANDEEGHDKMEEMLKNLNGPWSNAACMGYCLIAMRRAGLRPSVQRRVLLVLEGVFDEVSVEKAEKAGYANKEE